MVKIKCLSNGLYSLKNSHIPFGSGFQPSPPLRRISVWTVLFLWRGCRSICYLLSKTIELHALSTSPAAVPNSCFGQTKPIIITRLNNTELWCSFYCSCLCSWKWQTRWSKNSFCSVFKCFQVNIVHWSLYNNDCRFQIRKVSQLLNCGSKGAVGVPQFDLFSEIFRLILPSIWKSEGKWWLHQCYSGMSVQCILWIANSVSEF